MRNLRICTLAVVGLLLSGCAYTDHFNNRVATFDVEAAESRDTMILTNIVRASHAEPLAFVQLGQLSGTSGAQSTIGLPPIVFGPMIKTVPAMADLIFGGNAAGGSGFVGNSANASVSTNFQATPSETKDFYLGFLREVEPRTLALFTQQGASRELLFYLFTEKLVEQRGAQRRELRNDPLNPNFANFQQYVQLAMNYGLSSELVSISKPRKAKDSGSIKSSKDGADTGAKPEERWRLCFDRLYKSPNVEWKGNQPICGSGGASRDDRSVSFEGHDGQRVQLTVAPRSAFAIFQYLGRILAAGEKGRIHLLSPEAIDQPPLNDDILFDVTTTDAVGAGCFVSTYYEGQSYCVPSAGAFNTKRILSLLTQLIALNTAISDVPVAPTVRVIQ